MSLKHSGSFDVEAITEEIYTWEEDKIVVNEEQFWKIAEKNQVNK